MVSQAVKNLPSNSGDAGLIPGQGTKIPHASKPLSCNLDKALVWEQRPIIAKKKKKKREREGGQFLKIIRLRGQMDFNKNGKSMPLTFRFFLQVAYSNCSE